ncbi:hypothetical protein J437_LFUL011626 [Ladona fulva]|uniref:FHOD1 N-terminal GTPase-binding domain-containing protein n=1 Tax=Ladona fulva TaxID=123851 RepID=A0A8K0KDB2_LADFU|nr:hypothetical protein J437_LFUL011626 [Ladona fulva]
MEEEAAGDEGVICRVQFLNDIDPFAYSTHFPEPPRPPIHVFRRGVPLSEQVAAVHALLKAPHRVSRGIFIYQEVKQRELPTHVTHLRVHVV